jgi:hypothetical protein
MPQNLVERWPSSRRIDINIMNTEFTNLGDLYLSTVQTADVNILAINDLSVFWNFYIALPMNNIEKYARWDHLLRSHLFFKHVIYSRCSGGSSNSVSNTWPMDLHLKPCQTCGVLSCDNTILFLLARGLTRQKRPVAMLERATSRLGAQRSVQPTHHSRNSNLKWEWNAGLMLQGTTRVLTTFTFPACPEMVHTSYFGILIIRYCRILTSDPLLVFYQRK